MAWILLPKFRARIKMNISIESNIKNVLGEFVVRILQEDIPWAVKDAINDTMFELRNEQPKEIESVFDRPMRYTTNLSAWDIQKATAQNLTASLQMKPDQTEYLKWQVYGGSEAPKNKRKSKAHPMPQLKNGGSSFLSASGGLKTTWRRPFATKDLYFSGIPKGSDKPGSKILPIPGIYKRAKKTTWVKVGTTSWKRGEDGKSRKVYDKAKKNKSGYAGSHVGRLKLEITWEGTMDYKPKWDFHEHAAKLFSIKFQDNFRKRIKKAIAYREKFK